VLRAQRAQQAKERLAADFYEETGHVFTARPWSLPSPVLVTPARPLQRGARPTPSDGSRLRHTCATLMLANGVAPKVAAERLGHSDPSLFMNLYSHVTPSMQREAADKIGAALFG